MTDIGRRLNQLEEYFVDEAQTPAALAQRAYQAEWNTAGDTILATMSPEHRELIVELLEVIDASGEGPRARPDGSGVSFRIGSSIALAWGHGGDSTSSQTRTGLTPRSRYHPWSPRRTSRIVPTV